MRPWSADLPLANVLPLLQRVHKHPPPLHANLAPTADATWIPKGCASPLVYSRLVTMQEEPSQLPFHTLQG